MKITEIARLHLEHSPLGDTEQLARFALEAVGELESLADAAGDWHHDTREDDHMPAWQKLGQTTEDVRALLAKWDAGEGSK